MKYWVVAASSVIAGMGAMSSAGMLEDLAHDSHMRGLGCGPHRARDEVVLLHEGGEQQRVVPVIAAVNPGYPHPLSPSRRQDARVSIAPPPAGNTTESNTAGYR